MKKALHSFTIASHFLSTTAVTLPLYFFRFHSTMYVCQKSTLEHVLYIKLLFNSFSLEKKKLNPQLIPESNCPPSLLSISCSLTVALLVANCSSVKAAAIVQTSPEDQHMSDSRIFNIRPLLENAPKTQKNVRFSADTDEQEKQQFKRELSNSELFEWVCHGRIFLVKRHSVITIPLSGRWVCRSCTSPLDSRRSV